MTVLVSKEEWVRQQRPLVIQGIARRLGLYQRVPELMRKRGWPAEDQDLASVIYGAVACAKLGANFTWFKRPPGADALAPLWPRDQERVTAKQIMDTLDLDDLLQPA